MPGFSLTDFFFPYQPLKSQRFKSTKSKPHRPSITISKSTGTKIYPCLRMEMTPPPSRTGQYPGYRTWDDEFSAGPSSRDEYHVRSGTTRVNRGASLTSPPSSSSAHASLGGSVQPRRADVGANVLQFLSHWDELQYSRTCFVPLPAGTPGTSARIPGPGELDDRAVHFCVIDRTRTAWTTTGGNELILTCAAGNVRDVLSTLAPEGSGRRIAVVCRAPGAEEHGGIDLLYTAICRSWPFKIIIDA